MFGLFGLYFWFVRLACAPFWGGKATGLLNSPNIFLPLTLHTLGESVDLEPVFDSLGRELDAGSHGRREEGAWGLWWDSRDATSALRS